MDWVAVCVCVCVGVGVFLQEYCKWFIHQRGAMVYYYLQNTRFSEV
jgi:hypothetical protein